MSAASSPIDWPWSKPRSASKKLIDAAETLFRLRRFQGAMSRCWKTPVESPVSAADVHHRHAAARLDDRDRVGGQDPAVVAHVQRDRHGVDPPGDLERRHVGRVVLA